MRLGVTLPSATRTSQSSGPDLIKRFAKTAESVGVAGLWVNEHLLVPDSFTTAWLEPIGTLAFAAAVTDHVPLGTSILIHPLRHPVWVAKQAATLQYLANGRLTLGLGLGYIADEFDAVDVPFDERSGRFTEGLELLTRLLDGGSVDFDGEYYHVDGIEIEAVPQSPPRILIAGGGNTRDGESHVPEGVRERIAMADGWLSSSRETFGEDMAQIDAFLENSGRDPTESEKVVINQIHIVPGTDEAAIKRRQRRVYGTWLSEERGSEHGERHYFFGTVDDIVQQLRRYERAGFDQVILNPMTLHPEGMLRQLDLIAEYLPDEYL